MRIWMDMTAAPHVLVFRPLVPRLRARGHDVELTARDYGQTVGLLELHGMDATVFGAHGGGSRAGKLRALVSRTTAARRFARERGPFDLAIAHGSNDLALAARSLGIPAVDMFDYEWATLQHTIGCRLARRVMTPDRLPPERLRRYGVGPEKLWQFPGLKEDYYLYDFEPDPAVLGAVGVDPDRILVIMRPPPEVSMYHRHGNPLYGELIRRLGEREDVHAVVIPRTDGQRAELAQLALPSIVVPASAVDAQSLIAFADLVISAGGTMNREAVSLGTPVVTTFGGRPGGVDEALEREGLLRPLRDPAALELRKRAPGERRRQRRDPELLLDAMLAVA